MGFLDDMMAGDARDRAHRDRAAGRDSSASEAAAISHERRSYDKDARLRNEDNRARLEQQLRAHREDLRRERQNELRRLEEIEDEREARREARAQAQQLHVRAAAELVDQIAQATSLARKASNAESTEACIADLLDACLSCYRSRVLWEAFCIEDMQSRRRLLRVERKIQNLLEQRELPNLFAIIASADGVLKAATEFKPNAMQAAAVKLISKNQGAISVEWHRACGPLSEAAVALYESLPRVPGCDLLFPAPESGGELTDAALSELIDGMNEADLKRGGIGYSTRSKTGSPPHTDFAPPFASGPRRSPSSPAMSSSTHSRISSRMRRRLPISEAKYS